MYEAKTIPEAVRQFQQAALPHVSAIVKALGVPFNNNKTWKESKGTAGQWYRDVTRGIRVHFVMPVPLLKGHYEEGSPPAHRRARERTAYGPDVSALRQRV